ncbi:MAG: holo-ACP synthase [Christensenellales bacterium]
MIIGLGLDLCSVPRMAALLLDERFLNRFFSPGEREYIVSRGAFAAASMAACFAAKEAFAKAMGSGFEGISPSEIIVLHDKRGAPYYELTGGALRSAQEKGLRTSHLSLSHEGELAAAVAVLEGE